MTEKNKDNEKTKNNKNEKKYVLLELIRNSEIENNQIIGVLNDKEYKIYCNELLNDSYDKSNEEIITKNEFKEIIKRLGDLKR